MGYSCLVRTLIGSNCDGAIVPPLARLVRWIFPAAACASSPPATYDLTPAPAIFAALAGRGQLAVLRPDAIQPADSDRIVVRYDPQSVAYLTGAQWADKLPSLVQSRLIESFQNAHLLREVGRPGMLADSISRPAYGGSNWIRRKARQSVEISAQILSQSGRIIAGRLFSGTFQWRRANRRWSPPRSTRRLPSHARHRHLDRAEN